MKYHVEHAGTAEDFEISDDEIQGHVMEDHAYAVLEHWLRITAERIGCEPVDLDGETEEWLITSVSIVNDTDVEVIATPYRGEKATFTYTPPEM